MHLENKTWVESMKTLLGDDYRDSIIDYKKKPIEKENKELRLPKKNNTYNHMLAYLIKTRCIDKDIVYKLINDKKIYEDEKRNCVFLGYDENNRVKVFESPIEIMSYITLQRSKGLDE